MSSTQIPSKEAVAADPVTRPDVAPHEEDGGALIGVCGVTGAGKTVFLTCVFQTTCRPKSMPPRCGSTNTSSAATA